MPAKWLSPVTPTQHAQVVVPLHSSLTVADPVDGVAVTNHRPFAADAPTIERWADDVDVMGEVPLISLINVVSTLIMQNILTLHPYRLTPKTEEGDHSWQRWRAVPFPMQTKG